MVFYHSFYLILIYFRFLLHVLMLCLMLFFLCCLFDGTDSEDEKEDRNSTGRNYHLLSHYTITHFSTMFTTNWLYETIYFHITTYDIVLHLWLILASVTKFYASGIISLSTTGVTVLFLFIHNILCQHQNWTRILVTMYFHITYFNVWHSSIPVIDRQLSFTPVCSVLFYALTVGFVHVHTPHL